MTYKQVNKPIKSRLSRSTIDDLQHFSLIAVMWFTPNFPQNDPTVNKEYYFAVINSLKVNIRRKLSDLWANSFWILHHGNSPSYKAIILNPLFAKLNKNNPPNTVFARFNLDWLLTVSKTSINAFSISFWKCPGSC